MLLLHRVLRTANGCDSNLFTSKVKTDRLCVNNVKVIESYVSLQGKDLWQVVFSVVELSGCSCNGFDCKGQNFTFCQHLKDTSSVLKLYSIHAHYQEIGVFLYKRVKIDSLYLSVYNIIWTLLIPYANIHLGVLWVWSCFCKAWFSLHSVKVGLDLEFREWKPNKRVPVVVQIDHIFS